MGFTKTLFAFLLSATAAASASNVSVVSYSLAPLPNYALAFDLIVELSEPVIGIEVVWHRVDGIGDKLRLAVPSESTSSSFGGVKLMRLSPQQEYIIEVFAVVTSQSALLEDAATINVQPVLIASAFAGRTNLVTLDGVSLDDLNAPLCEVSGNPTWDVLVFDHSANSTVLLGVDRLGWIVYYLAPQNTNQSWVVNGPNLQLDPTGSDFPGSTRRGM